MNHPDAIQLGKKYLEQRHNASFFAIDTHHKYGERPDIICLVKDEVWQVEVKVSRSDFLANRNKKLLGIGHRRYFLVMAGVCFDYEVPWGHGLLQIQEDDAERPYIFEVRSSVDFKMTHAAIAQTIKLYANQERRVSKKEPTGEWADVEKLLELEGEHGLTLKQIGWGLNWRASRRKEFERAAKRRELPETISYEYHVHPWVFRSEQ